MGHAQDEIMLANEDMCSNLLEHSKVVGYGWI
jgi:hypothetical protein